MVHEIKVRKVQNGFIYTVNGKENVQLKAEDILQKTIEAVNADLNQMKTGDNYTIKVEFDRA